MSSRLPDPLASLNPAQRQAVEHGVADGDTRPLLIIAGAVAGSLEFFRGLRHG